MRIDTELLKAVDEARGTKTRTSFVEDALRAHLYLEPEPDSIAAKEPDTGPTRSERIDQRVKELRAQGVGTYAAKDQAEREIT